MLGHQTRLNTLEETGKLTTPQFLAKNRPPRVIRAMNLQNRLCQVETDCRNLRHGRRLLLD